MLIVLTITLDHGIMAFHFIDKRMETLFQREPQLLKQILHRYLFQAEVLPNIGLYQGKLGVTILYYYYGRYAGSELHTQFADELLDLVVNDIPSDGNVGFGYGLTGIAWGIHHLIAQGFIDGDIDELLSDLDDCIMQRDLRRIVDLSFDMGFSGVNHYVETRLHYAKAHQQRLPFDETYLLDVQNVKNSSDLEYCNGSDVFMKMWCNLKSI